jgi:two-component system chemotaxis sensor kinase CheA
MNNDVSSEQLEIMREFVHESRDMLDRLEPIIIELGQSCQHADCWSMLNCPDQGCARFGQQNEQPCWLHKGFIAGGDRSCGFAASEQDCKACAAFHTINGDPGTMNAIFRLFHSMKGSAGFLELNNISHVAHAAESLLDLIRSGKIRLEPEHVNLLCQSCDFAREALDNVDTHFHDQNMRGSAETMAAALEGAIGMARFRAENSSGMSDTLPVDGTPPVALPALEDLITPELAERFCLEADELLQNIEQGLLRWIDVPEDLETVRALFRDIHSLKGNCGFFGYGDPETLSHRMETILDEAKSGRELTGTVNPAEVLLTMVDVLKDGIANISRGGDGRLEGVEQHIATLDALLVPRLGELMVDQGLVDPATLEAALQAQERPLGQILVEMGKVTQAQVDQTVAEQQKQKFKDARTNGGKEKTAPVARQDIRVDLDKLDKLIDLIGEMVIAENMLLHNPDLHGLELENFHKAGQQMNKIVRELQEMTMVIRMIPISGLFRRMIRLVHDLSNKSGKKIELKLFGEETEVDKTVIETITDPLVHLLRNSMDHGLEPPDERRAAGKTEKGTIELSARHEEGEVWITIEDDGRGLNREKILNKAREKGMIQGDGAELSDKVVYSLIFQPGFSTADRITDISGRGVGMDVVKQNLEKIKGSIDVLSRPGHGTRITLRIPLTLGIIDGMLIRSGRAKCIVPLLAVREIFRPEERLITITPDGGEIVRVRESFFPILRLHEIIKNEPDSTRLEDGVLIVLEHQENRVCLFADEILGQQQTVIKGLPDYLGQVRAASGCTILGDGEVCIILDVGHLVAMKEPEEA